ncbi:hypothetical protein Kpol_505p4 [Vanderwaltozyma polyspora DSM 70294]|uniref:MICOS complex subunit MIC27 n=1 Tax=Vanderwaltozyma polyspora (strain ATCC 22028 / DSM 70294 / BCRC 21397 / CBS 2163 / NBRC 10782 / NRRL Y-8283 / UCD 57-17) TaxID=436907 RepID=MIC27_VANPO|nr:uncharacterized protein Kpol_505p4 [Vanderwaltozyma polyspora DSM 70294]A7TN96.1 RecName: Full=MICOS complex subunit MIC27 [Vanderwaltozyma polyspora DSM 70294]EDO16228.1 hypothetical protein Kpol_505p4 [Vanderwaltozyma polyspora DSM 70294]
MIFDYLYCKPVKEVVPKGSAPVDDLNHELVKTIDKIDDNVDNAAIVESNGSQWNDVVKYRLSDDVEITGSEQLTESIRGWRLNIVDELDKLRSKWDTGKQEMYDKKTDTNAFLNDNVFNNKFENEELVVPSVFLSFGAFCSGRILSNPKNWGHSKTGSLTAVRSGLLYKSLTNLPSRLLLPWIFAGYTFSQFSPKTFDNICKVVEEDLLPPAFAKSCRDNWNSIYVNGIKKHSQGLSSSIDENLQNSIRSIREFIYKSLY